MSCEFSIIPYESGDIEPQQDSDGNYYSLLSFTQAGGQDFVIIKVDGSTTNNSFYQTETNGSWFSVERRRNEIIIRVQPNFTTEERDGYVEYAHNCDANKTCQICIHQCPTEYQISAELKELEFENWNKEDSREIAVTTKGGSGRFYVKSVKQYQEKGLCIESKEVATTDSDGNETTTFECTEHMDLQVEYDDGLKLILEQPEECVEDDSGECPNCTGNGTLTIKSYGRTFVDENNYYIITLAHLDYRFATCEIRVEYALPDRTLCLSSDNILFDYNKKLLVEADTSDSQTIDISFCETSDCNNCEEHPDYGYEYEIITDCCDEDSDAENDGCTDCSWLTITENPTSITVECEINTTIYDRSVAVKIYSIDNPDCYATLTVKQKGYTDYDVALSDEKITVDYDDTQTYEVYIYVYAYTFDEKDMTEDEFWEGYVEDFIKGETCADGDDKWVDVSYGGYRNTDFYTEITLNVKFTQNSGNADRDCSVTFKHPTQSDKTVTLTLLQYAEGNYKVITQKEIGTYDGDTKTTTIYMEAAGDSYYLIASSTATWCSATIGGNDDLDVILKCTPNYWKETRYCVVTVTDTINSTVYRYMMTQVHCDESERDDEGNPTCDPYEFSVALIED